MPVVFPESSSPPPPLVEESDVEEPALLEVLELVTIITKNLMFLYLAELFR